MSPTFRSLHNANYRLYAAGGLVSNTGTWMQRVAQDWLVLQLTGNSGLAIGITTGLQFLPFLLLGPVTGMIADRVSKRRLLQVTNLAMALPAVVLAILAITGVAQPWHVYLLALTLGVGAALDAPARQSFVSEIVGPDDLPNAARVVGPAVAGVLISALGGGAVATGWVIGINAVSYLAPVLALARMDPEQLDSPLPSRREPGMIVAGFRYVRSRRDLILILAAVFFTGTFGLNFQMTSALMATEVFHKGATEYGLLGTIMAIGSLTGSLIAARRQHVRVELVIGAALVFAAVEIGAGLMPTYLTYAATLPLLGVSALTMITAANAFMQLGTDPGMRGRVMALYMMIFMGGTPIGSPIIGWVGEAFGARWTLVGGGAATAIGVALAWAWFARQPDGSRPPGLVGDRAPTAEPAAAGRSDDGRVRRLARSA